MSSLTTAKLDKAAISISALCLVHCLVLPITLAVLPSMTLLTMLNDEVFHLVLVALVLPTSLIALTMGCRRHKNFFVLVLGLAGVLTLLLTALFAHDLLGEATEKGATVFGTLLIAVSHIQNFRLCRTLDCVE